MLDVGWTEIVFIVLIAVLVIGPKELPQMMYALGKLFRRFQYMRFAISSQFDDFMQQAQLREQEEEKTLKPNPAFTEQNFFAEENEEEDEDEIEMELSFLRDIRKDRDDE